MPKPFARKPKPRNVYIDNVLWQWVVDQAAKDGSTASEIVRRSLEKERNASVA